jgi:simple sugar transport system permease protein
LTTKIKRIEDRILDIFTGSNAVISVLVVFLGFLVGTLLIILIGKNPSVMYQSLLQVVSGFDSRRGAWNIRYVGEWIVISLPLILCGLSMGFSVRAGLFNIGAEGQYIAGLTAAQLIAAGFVRAGGERFPVHFSIAVLGAIFFGALWGGIAGFLKAKYKVSEVVATIMMNYIAFFMHRFISLNTPGSNTFRTPNYPVNSSLSNPFLSEITNKSNLNNGLWFTIAAVVIYWLVMEKSTFGFSLKATGFNRDAALYAGMRVKTNITAAMAVSGGFAGLAGAVVSLGVFSYGRILTSFDNYGFDGIAVALAGNCSALGISIMGLLFGMLKSAQPLMQLRQIPKEIASIIIGLVVIFIALRPGVKMFVEWRRKNSLTTKNTINKK